MGNISNLLKQMVSRQTLKKNDFSGPLFRSSSIPSHNLCMSMEYLFANAWALSGAAGWRHMTFFIFAIECHVEPGWEFRFFFTWALRPGGTLVYLNDSDEKSLVKSP